MSEATRRGIGIETLIDGDPATGDTLHDVSNGAGDGNGDGAPDAGAAAAAEAEEPQGRRGMIGRFIRLGMVGAGGMGYVYSAYDPHLDRKVAIKLLRGAVMLGGGADAQTRLLREAQAMAKINHPNVVKVHEVGIHDDQVYVAMELADAGTLKTWLKERRTRREILDVFVGAGRGLAAAHAAGLVHRDFKPDNVLMARDGSVRVTDFGLVAVATPSDEAHAPAGPPHEVPALSLSGSVPLSASLTRTGSIMGTPSYMAPEQFRSTPATARADQFSFCVVLYEALYGARPFAGKGYQELAANVLAGKVSPAPAGARVPGWLRRVLLRGLGADPAARYPSMDALLSELARDRTRRWRRRLAWTAGAGVLAAAAAAIALPSGDGAVCDAGGDRAAGLWNPARRDRMQAAFAASGRPHAAASFDKLTHLIDDWARSWEAGYRDACEDTRVRREQSEHLLDLRMGCLTRRLGEADATIALLAAGGGDAVDRALEAAMALPAIAPCGDAAALTAAVAPPETELARVQVQAVRGRLDEARALERLGRYAAARELARPALAVARATGYRPVTAEALLVVGRNGVALADAAGIAALRESMHAAAASGDAAGMIDAAAWLIHAHATQGGRYEVAHELAELAEATATHARPRAELAVGLQVSIGRLEEARGRPAEARARYTGAVALAEAELGPDHPTTLVALTRLGNLAKTEARFADARQLLERVLASREQTSGKDHPDVASALLNLGTIDRAQGKLDDAQRLYDRALAIRIAALGPDHPDVGASYNGLGTLYTDREDHVTAVRYFEQALALLEKVYGPDNIEIAEAVKNLGTSLSSRGQYEQAALHLERVIALNEAARGPEHPAFGRAIMNLGVTRVRQGKLDDAFTLFQRAARIAEQTYGPDHPDVADALTNLATVLRKQRKPDEARAMTLRTLHTVEQVYGTDHPRVAVSLLNLGNLLYDQKDHAGALEAFRRSVSIIESRLGKDHVHLGHGLAGSAGALIALDRRPEAIPLLERALRIRTAAGLPPNLIAEVRVLLADALVLDPRTRARAIAEARTAVAEYEQAGDAANAAEARAWLAKHR